MKIKRIETKTGRVMYFADGKMVSADVLPDGVKLENGQEIEIDPVKHLPQFDTKICLFDESPATHRKFLHERTIGLCDDCYANKTTGQIASRMEK